MNEVKIALLEAREECIKYGEQASDWESTDAEEEAYQYGRVVAAYACVDLLDKLIAEYDQKAQ
jgi:hypothetical protein